MVTKVARSNRTDRTRHRQKATIKSYNKKPEEWERRQAQKLAEQAAYRRHRRGVWIGRIFAAVLVLLCIIAGASIWLQN